MCNTVLHSMKSTVISRTVSGRYVLMPGDTHQTELVPMDKMHLCVFDDSLLDDNGFLREGAVVETVRMSNGWIYASHKVYPPVGDKLSIPRSESRPVEFKGSFLHFAGEKKSDPLEHKVNTQLHELAATLSGFSNSRIEKGTCYVGVNNSGEVVPDLEAEIGESVEEFEADYRNRLAGILSSSTFAAKYLSFQWKRQKGRLYCKIEVRPYPRILFVSGRYLYTRSEAAATVSLANQDIVDFCKSWEHPNFQ